MPARRTHNRYYAASRITSQEEVVDVRYRFLLVLRRGCGELVVAETWSPEKAAAMLRDYVDARIVREPL